MSLDPKIVAILNVTEDSFSDGGLYLSPKAAIAHAEALIGDSADILELGPASSHPDAAHVTAADQIERLRPVLAALNRKSTPLSVDATDTDVLRFALEHEVSFVNDVRGFGDKSLYPDLAASSASLVVVHSILGEERATRDAATVERVLESIDRFFSKRLNELVCAGVAENRLIVDPGMGFFLGANVETSIAVLRGIEGLRRKFNRPVFISVSRKSFLRKVTGRSTDELSAATLAAELFAAAQGAAFLRTHDPRSLRDGLMIQSALA